MIILKLSYFSKINSRKIEVLGTFGSRDQESDFWFTNHELLKFLLLVFIYSFYVLNTGDLWLWPAVVSSTTNRYSRLHKHTHIHI